MISPWKRQKDDPPGEHKIIRMTRNQVWCNCGMDFKQDDPDGEGQRWVFDQLLDTHGIHANAMAERGL